MSDITDLPPKIRERIKLVDCPRPNLEGECWQWTGVLNHKGYGHVYFDGTTRRVHRVVFELLVAAIPDGLQLDHLCLNKACANPAHLELVTNRENSARTERATKTHCIRGHELSGHNLIVKSDRSNGRRQCRECKRLSRAGKLDRPLAVMA